MRFLLLSLVLALFCAHQAFADDYAAKEQACKKKSPTMWAHIGTYCYNGGAHVVSPGSHANLGKNKYVGNKVYFLAIRSGAQRGIRQPRGPKCSPPALVPQYWCRYQFFDMCAAKKSGEPFISRNYGTNGCQEFVLSVTNKVS